MRTNPDKILSTDSEKQYRSFFENSLDAILITSQDGSIYSANPAACKMLGWSEKELCSLGRKGIVDNTPKLFEALEQRRKTGKYFGELTYIKKDGTKFPVEISSSVFANSDGRELTTIIIRDITERKKTEKSLLESEARLRLASQATGFGIYSYDFVTHVTYFSDEFLALYGILPGNIIEHNIDLLSRSFYPEDKEYFLNAIYKANDPEGSGILDVEFRIVKPDGEIRWLKARGRTIFSGNSKKDKPIHSNGLMQDITERKVIENALKQAHDWQETIFEGSIDAIFISGIDAHLIAVNKAACDLTGYSREQLLTMSMSDLQVEKDLEAFRKYNERIFNGEKILSEAKILRRDGIKIDTEFNNSCIPISGIYYMHTTARDISGRKKAEMALKQSEGRYRNLFENSPIGIAITNKMGNLLQANLPFARMYGYSDTDQLLSEVKNVRNLFSNASTGNEMVEIIGETGKIAAQEIEVIKRDGTHFFVLSSGTDVLDADGNFLFYQSNHIDLTDRKIIEDRIKTSEAEYRSLFENSIMGISQALPDGKIIRINKAYADMYGYPDTSIMLRELTHGAKILYSNPDDRRKVLELLDKYGFMLPTEFELNRRNGEKFWALVSAICVNDNTGKLLYLQAEHIDITGRKKLEKEMYSASLYARNLIEASLDPLVTISADGKITDVNLSTEKITGITRKKLIGSDFADYFSDPVKARKVYKKVFSEGIVKDYPLTIIHKNGKEIDVLYNASLFKDETGNVQGVLAAARDITELKKIEEELRKSKDLLERLNQHLVEVRENERNQIALNLHDDLGQKLTAINLDIAWLKSRIGVQSKTVREKFEEMSSMIKETIESTKKTSAFLRPAILFDLGLVSAIKSQLVNFEKQTGIKCNFYFRPEEILLEDRLSLVLYRIFQESVTNVARHSGASKADINLYVLKNKIKLVVKDDGTGIENSKVNSIKSMGIAGIKERVKSVNGKMTIIGIHGSGTTVRVEIPLLKGKTND